MENGKRIACLLLRPGLPEKSLQALAEACYRFSPMLALRPDEAIFLEIGGSRRLFSEASVAARLSALAKRFLPNGEAFVAIENDAGTALAMARQFGRSGTRRELLSLESLRDYLNPFSPDLEELKRMDRMIQLLKTLGIRNLGDLLALPSSSLASRLGKAAVEVRARVQGALDPAWPGFHLTSRVREVSDQGGENLEALTFVLRGLIDRATARLRGRCERAAVIEVGLELERWSTSTRRPFRVEFPLPQGSSAGMLSIIQERLAFQLEREPLDAPVQSVSFEVIETVPGRGAQRDFFSRKEEEDEALESLLARLSQKLGAERVFHARTVERYLPERAYEKSQEAATSVSAEEFAPARPTRLLREPERVEIRGRRVLARGGRQWTVVSWDGPERISGEWWRGNFDRDYYRVVLEGGAEPVTGWVYLDREAQPPVFYLHGFFD